LPSLGGSNWIGPSSSGSGLFSDFLDSPAIALTYQTTFTLPADATSVTISGWVAVDNSLDEVLLNGNSVAYASGTSLTNLTLGDDEEAFTQMNPISFSSNVMAGAGETNTLDFVADNQANTPTGIDINISGTYTVPEPASTGLLAVAAVGLLRRRRRRVA
jgi:hypothetical protein